MTAILGNNPCRLLLCIAKLTHYQQEALWTDAHSYNEVLPLMMARYLGPGLLGLA